VTRVLISIANDLLSLPLTEAKAVEKTSTCEPARDSILLLTQRLAAGEEEAFIEFHHRYFDRLYHFLLVITRGQEAEAQEALQLTFLRVVRYRRAFEHENAFWCWLKVLARSAARDAGRKQQRYQTLLNRFALWRRDSPAEFISHTDDQLHQSLDECLSDLDETDRALIESKYIDGTTIRELCAQTGSTEKAMESRLLRLRRRLRQNLLNKLKSP
jgi:RNA polymerase sigma-70 factor (ECF subfamily)